MARAVSARARSLPVAQKYTGKQEHTLQTVLCISAYPRPGILPRVAILVIVIVAALVAAVAGMPFLETIMAVAAAVMAAGPVAQALLPRPAAGAIG